MEKKYKEHQSACGVTCPVCWGNIDDCELTDEDRKNGINIENLVAEIPNDGEADLIGERYGKGGACRISWDVFLELNASARRKDCLFTKTSGNFTRQYICL